MRGALALLWLSGCTWISPGEWLQAADRDGDGFPATEAGGSDCDDADPSVNPDAEETCDGRDEDCDGQIDEDLAGTQDWYPDADADGYGAPGDPTSACAMPEGYGEGSEDCDDSDPTVFPGAPELLDGADQDCDGVVDELTLPDSADWTLWGSEGYERAGHSSQARADLDADGHAELVAVLPRGGGGGGLVGLWWGGSLALAGEDDSSTWQPDLRILGPEGGEGIWAVPGDGALDGEGATLLLASPADSEPACHLFFGEGLPETGSAELDDADITMTGCGGQEPGRLAWGGDLDGDGYADLPALPSGEAQLYVLAGRTSSHWNRLDRNDLPAEAELAIDASALTGRLVVRLEGDLDGDGLDDLLVAAPVAAGLCMLVYGGDSLLAGGTAASLPDDADAQVAGQGATDALGEALTATSDLNGDGRAELLLASPGAGEVRLFVQGTERWSGVLDPEQDAFATWHGPTGAGAGLSAGPDVDGDGAPDVLVGADGAATAAWLVTAPATAGSHDLDDLSSTTMEGMRGGATAVLAEDLDGDGAGELLLADPDDATRAVEGGALHLVFGYR